MARCVYDNIGQLHASPSPPTHLSRSVYHQQSIITLDRLYQQIIK